MNFFKKLFKSTAPKTGVVFIVEDDATYAKTLELFLKSHFPYIREVSVFSDGYDCLQQLYKNPDAIIMDYFLDTKNDDMSFIVAETGLEIIDQIRTQKLETNIIVLSSQTEISVATTAIKKYNCSYIKKDKQAFERVEQIIKEIYTSEKN